MSLYNSLFSTNPLADILLELLGLSRAAVGRFRDCFLTEKDGSVVIAVYTRNGGGNREHYAEDTKEGEDCDCYACAIGYRLPKHLNYLSDADDEFDCTYATIWFSIPEKHLKAMADAIAEEPNIVTDVEPGHRFAELLEKMKSGDKDDPEGQRAFETGKRILGPVIESLEKAKE